MLELGAWSLTRRRCVRCFSGCWSLEFGAWRLRAAVAFFLLLPIALDSDPQSMVILVRVSILLINYLNDFRSPFLSPRRVIAGLRQHAASPVAFCPRGNHSRHPFIRRRGTAPARFCLELQLDRPADRRLGPGPDASGQRLRYACPGAGNRFRPAR